jgi:hypothetical protein
MPVYREDINSPELGFSGNVTASVTTLANTWSRDVCSVTVVGDGIGYYMIDGYAAAVSASIASSTQVFLCIRDAAYNAGTGAGGENVLAVAYSQLGGVWQVVCLPKARVPAWTGSKTLYLNVGSNQGLATCYADPSYPAFLRVYRA